MKLRNFVIFVVSYYTILTRVNDSSVILLDAYPAPEIPPPPRSPPEDIPSAADIPKPIIKSKTKNCAKAVPQGIIEQEENQISESSIKTVKQKSESRNETSKQGTSQLEAHVTQIDKKLDQIDNKLSHIKDSSNTLDESIKPLERNLQEIDSKMNQMDQQLQQIGNKVQQMTDIIPSMEEKVNTIAERVSVLEGQKRIAFMNLASENSTEADIPNDQLVDMQEKPDSTENVEKKSIRKPVSKIKKVLLTE